MKFNDIVCKYSQKYLSQTDSCENLIDINLLFEIRKFYDEHFMNYSREKYGILFEYDLELGVSYGEMLSVRSISDKTIEVSGTGIVLQKFLWKIENESDLEISINVPKESIVPDLEENPMVRFIKDKQVCMEMDYSKYTVQVTKLN